MYYRAFVFLFAFLIFVVLPDRMMSLYRHLFKLDRTWFDVTYALLYTVFGIYMLYLVNVTRLEIKEWMKKPVDGAEKKVDEWGDELK